MSLVVIQKKKKDFDDSKQDKSTRGSTHVFR